MALELIPIGTILAVLTNQVIKTAQAAKDVFDRESFKVLSNHLFDIELVLKELQRHEVNDSQATRLALEFLERDVKMANNLVEKYKNRSRFYLLVRCRHMVKDVQEVTRDIGKSLAALSLANAEVLSRISDQVNRLQTEMQRVEFEASQSQLQVFDRLNQALKDQILDQGSANNMLELIAMEVGVPLEPSKISKELADIRQEKEEAASKKEKAEAYFLGQVIELLSRADAARDYEEVKKTYNQRVQAIERYDTSEEYIPPLKAFICCLKRTVMVEPVSLDCTGTTCERAALIAWLESGERTDPETREVLGVTSWRPNLPLRQSIEEWRELNYCLKIRSCKVKLVSGVEMLMLEVLNQMRDLIRENSIIREWMAIEGLTDIIISILETSHNKDVKHKILITLRDIVEGHARNKDEVVESPGWDRIIGCLGRDSSISKAAIELLYELLQDISGWNVPVCKKLSQKSSSIIFLVTLVKGPVQESAEIAEKILMKLFDIDEENISRAAKSGWYKPLIDRIVQGPEKSRIAMVKTLVDMELVDSNLKLLSEEGVIPPLLEMLSGNIESKESSLSALVQLSSCHANREVIASLGGVNLVLKLMSTTLRSIIVAKCYEMLEKFTSDEDGAKFFVDENGCRLEMEPIVTKLIELQQNPTLSYNVRRPALQTLHGICKFDASLVKKAVLTANAISLVLPLLDNTESAIRDIAISLLFLFSQHEPEDVVEYLLRPRRLEALVGFLENDDKGDVQMAAAGILANLPKAEQSLTMKLIELGGHTAIMNILRTGNMEAKENALTALFRFTDPTNLESQRMLVEGGIYPLLVSFLKSSSVTAKARAAALIGNLSTSSQKLTVASKPTGCWCFKASGGAVCPAHGGLCSVTSTFCLLEAKALPELVKLISGEVYETSIEAIQTLSTLVAASSSQRAQRGAANVLHEADAIIPILDTLHWGTDSLKEEALSLLEKVFLCKEMVEMYGSVARMRLAALTSRNMHEDGRHRRKAATVMALLERYSKSSISIVPSMHA